MRRALRVVAVVLALGLLGTACGSEDPEKFTGTRLEQPYAAPDLALTSTTGKAYSLVADTSKALTLVFFGYTNCPDRCPMVLNNLAAAMNRLTDDERKQVDVVLVTTDPARDDVKTLQTYLARYDADFIGLTGDLDTIMAVGDPLHVYINDGKRLPTGGYDLGGHSTITLAIGSDDKAVALWNEQTSSTEFAADLHTLLSED